LISWDESLKARIGLLLANASTNSFGFHFHIELNPISKSWQNFHLRTEAAGVTADSELAIPLLPSTLSASGDPLRNRAK
jgi:hypothetical protein